MIAKFTSSSDSTTLEPPRKQQKGEFKLLKLIDDFVNPSQENQTAATSREREQSLRYQSTSDKSQSKRSLCSGGI